MKVMDDLQILPEIYIPGGLTIISQKTHATAQNL